MKYRFTPEDFKSPKAHMISQKDCYCAEKANALLEKWESVMVFGNWNDDTDSMSFDWTVGVNKEDNVKAILWNPRPIK